MAATPTYGVLGAILAAAAGVYTYLASQHAEGGHKRHDDQSAVLDQKVNNTTISFENRLHEHIIEENQWRQRIGESVDRIESKLDDELTSHGHRFPTSAPPLTQIPIERRASYSGDGGIH